MIVHLIDGTYELFRHFYGLRRFNKGEDRPSAPWSACCSTVLQMIEKGATHIGVATDHVIESFRNELWPGYKTGEGIEPALLRAVPSARGSARRDGRRRVADGRARSGRCARLRRAARGRGRARARKSASGRRTRTSRNACAAIASCRSIARAKAIRDAAGVRAEVRRRAGAASPTISRWSATRRTAIPASPASARSGRRGC